MQRKHRDDMAAQQDAVKTNTIGFPSLVPSKTYESRNEVSKNESQPTLSFIGRRLEDLGALDMTVNSPKGFQWNATNISVLIGIATFLLVCASLIAGGSWYLGYQASELQHLKDAQKITEATASDAKDTAGKAKDIAVTAASGQTNKGK